ncbi:MAG: hypothetical protein IKO40_02600 [Kiritimatiellae bacterium]|nr:hypothetical protein [Kiritimatiellia bacterium]
MPSTAGKALTLSEVTGASASNGKSRVPTILCLNMIPGDAVQERLLAGIHRGDSGNGDSLIGDGLAGVSRGRREMC